MADLRRVTAVLAAVLLLTGCVNIRECIGPKEDGTYTAWIVQEGGSGTYEQRVDGLTLQACRSLTNGNPAGRRG